MLFAVELITVQLNSQPDITTLRHTLSHYYLYPQPSKVHILQVTSAHSLALIQTMPRMLLVVLAACITAISISNYFLLLQWSPPQLSGRFQILQNTSRITNFAFKDLSTFSVDILSVASIDRPDLIEAQQRTFASHTSVRNFFVATELDDADPECHKHLTWEHVVNISNFCRERRKGLSDLFRYMRGQYARVQWLEKKTNPRGWMCAQSRPYSGLIKAFNHYRDHDQELPHYFIIMDDDTYYNMELFQENFEIQNHSVPSIIAGCLVRLPIHQVNFTFPFGG